MRIPIDGLRHALKAFYDFLKAAPSLLNEYETVTTGAVAKSADITVFKTSVVTGATEGNETLNIGNGSGAIVGQRKLVTLTTRSHASDVVVLDHANMVYRGVAPSAVQLDAANEYVLLEWNGTKWDIIAQNATVTASVPTGIDSGFYLTTSDTLTTGAAPVSIPLTAYKTVITTGGTQAAETANIGDGTGALNIGQRKLVTLGTLTDPSDSVTLDHANMSHTGFTVTGVSLDAASEFILLEWNGSKWEIIWAASGVVTES